MQNKSTFIVTLERCITVQEQRNYQYRRCIQVIACLTHFHAICYLILQFISLTSGQKQEAAAGAYEQEK